MSVRGRSCFFLSAVVGILGGFAGQVVAQTASPVAWGNTVNAAATGSTLQKTGGCGGCTDAGGTSTQVLSAGDGYVQFAPVAGARLYAGLGSNATSNTDPALIEYAFSFWPDGGWDIRERNVYKSEGRFVSGDSFRVAIVAGAVKYYQNGALVYSSLAVPASPLVLDASLIGAGAGLTSAVITGTALPVSPSAPSVAIVTSVLPNGVQGQAYTAALQASGGSGTFSWRLMSGALPAGFTITSAGTITGTPTSVGTAQFTVRATDVGNATNLAERALTIAVSAVTGAVAVQTMTIPPTRIAQAYTTTLQAAGGSGGFRWSIVAGALPGGLSLDAASGTLQGTASVGGKFVVTVRATDALNAGNVGDRTLSLRVLAEAPPSMYDGVSDRTTRIKGALPSLGAAGYTFSDPDFGTRVMRVTDGRARPGTLDRSYRTPSSTHANAWSADARYFYTVSTDGTILPFSFDRATMRAQRLQPSGAGDGGLTLRFFNEPTFSYLIPGVAYGTFSGTGSNLRSIDQYDFDTGQYLQLINLDTLAPNLAGTYTGGLGASAGPVERLFAFFGGISQDRHFYIVVFDRNNPANRHLLDTAASTIDGVPTNTLLNFKIHAANIDRSGRYVTIYPTGGDLQAPRFAAPVYVWDIETGTFTALPLAAARTGGHDAFGYGERVNQDCCSSTTWDAAQWQYRSLATPLATFDLVAVLQPKEIYLADHPSWHNAQPDRLVPFIDANYRYGANTTVWRAWDEEIIAVQTGAGSGGTVWRFAHHRSAVADDLDPSRISFWYTPRANVSPDGQWALFTSNWEKTLGTDPGGDPGGSHRQDVFLIELKQSAGAPQPAGPVAVVTSTLPSGTVAQTYATALQAVGGSGTYGWSIVSGALPAGLALDSATGTITGTPGTAGAATFTARASDLNAPVNVADRTFNVTIAPAPIPAVQVMTTAVPGGTVSKAYTTTLQATGGIGTYAWSVASGALPGGLTLSVNGTLAGTPSTAGTFTFSVRASDAVDTTKSAQQSLTMTIAAATVPLAIPQTTLTDAYRTREYGNLLPVSGGTAPFTWAITAGMLPPGLTLDATTGRIGGTPTEEGRWIFTVRVTDSATPAATAKRTLSIRVR
jgi:hypothetical protein